MSLLLAGLVGSFAFFAVVPRTKTWFSALGGATLVVYLFHGFFVLGAEFAGFIGLGRGPLAALAGPGHAGRRCSALAFLAWQPRLEPAQRAASTRSARSPGGVGPVD